MLDAEKTALIAGNKEISRHLNDGQLFSVGRFGAVEFELVKKVQSGTRLNLIDRKMAWVNAGIWPPTTSSIKAFASFYAQAIACCDALAIWPESLLEGQTKLLSVLAPGVDQFPLGALDPVLLESLPEIQDAWSRNLAGKRVLVVHSMQESISHQHPRLALVHSDGLIPDFELAQIQPPETNGLIFWRPKFVSQLESFEKKLEAVVREFQPEIALVAAGAYGMPILRILRDKKVSAIYVGGALQLMFGIMGHRWRNRPEVVSRLNNFWLDAPLESPPFGFKLIEKGTYW